MPHIILRGRVKKITLEAWCRVDRGQQVEKREVAIGSDAQGDVFKSCKDEMIQILKGICLCQWTTHTVKPVWPEAKHPGLSRQPSLT